MFKREVLIKRKGEPIFSLLCSIMHYNIRTKNYEKKESKTTSFRHTRLCPHRQFRTIENGDKHIRIFIKDYKLGSNSELESITIQNQLY